MKFRLLFILLLLPVAVAVSSPLDGLLERIDKGASKKIMTRLVDSDTDFFEIGRQGDRVLITGNNYVSVATGINWYLKYHLGIHLSWNNMQSPLPATLPLPATTERREAACGLRYYLNYCTFSYSMAFWDWQRWEREIDWMALHGINMPLAAVGQELLWRNFLERLGYPKEKIARFIAGPGFMAWFLMGNLEGWGGPSSEAFCRRQAKLQRQILARMREYGMSPVLPGYYGMVPHDAREELGLEVSDPGLWCSFNRPAFLLPTDPRYKEIAELFYDESDKLYGKARFYSMDPFHEGGRVDGVDLPACGQAILRAMKENHPEATWILQAWQENPRQELIETLPKGDLLILDLTSECQPQWGDPESSRARKEGYAGHDWAFCMILNYGGNVGLHGRMAGLTKNYRKARGDAKAGPAMQAVGLTMEGIENNPVMYELLTELPWRPEAFEQREWLADYLFARYGSRDETLEKAWQLLAESIYACPDGSEQQGTTESLFCARPSLGAKDVSSWAVSTPYYDPGEVFEAARLFLSVAEKYRGHNNFEYDLIDLVRQAVAEAGRIVLQEVKTAFETGNETLFEQRSADFIRLIDQQDKLLGTRREFRLGNWIAQSRSLGRTTAERDLLEWNARVQLTTWGNRTAAEEGGLRDYAHKEWNGLLGSLYRERWSRYFESLSGHLQGQPLVPIDFYTIEETWNHSRDKFSAEPEGSPVDAARAAFRTLSELINL